MRRNGSAAVVIILIVVIILAVVGGVWYYKVHKVATPSPIQASSQNSTTAANTSTAVEPSSSTSLASTTQITPSSVGSVINDEYDLFILTSLGQDNCGNVSAIHYYDGGTVSSGSYSGYHRIIAAVPLCGPPGGYFAVIFATQDYQHFIIDPNSLANISIPEGSYFAYNPAKVTAVSTDLPIDSPPLTIPLDNFVLVQRNDYNDIYYYGSTPTSTPLTSLVPGLTFYGDTGSTNTLEAESAVDPAYLGNDDVILIKTDSGPLFEYLLVSKEEFDAGSSTLDYIDDGNKIFYRSTQISSTAPLYQTYGQLAPGVCGPLNITYILNNILKSDLVQIGTTLQGAALYTLENSDHPLNHDEFNAKVTPWAATTTTDNGIPVPTYSAYIAKDPVLIFQDPWGRWVGLGEIDIPTTGGCG